MTKRRKITERTATPAVATDGSAGGHTGGGGGCRRPTVLPPDSTQTPTTARGMPSTDVPKTRKTILQDMSQSLLGHERNYIDAGDRTLDDGAHQFILDTLRTNWDDSNDETDVPNLPILTKNILPNLPIPRKS